MRYLLVVLMLSLMAAGQGQDAASLASKVDKTDPALTNARTPTAHTHTKSQITDLGAVGGGLDAGLIVLSDSSCPSGYTELAALAGLTLKVTSTTNGDAGQTGGSNSFTPQGTVAVTVDNHAAHQHNVAVVTNRTAAATSGSIYTPKTLGSTSLASGTTNVTTGDPAAALTHNVSSSTFAGQTVNLDLAHVNLLLCKKN